MFASINSFVSLTLSVVAMCQDALGQDMFLLGSPGPYRRQLAMAFCELTGREGEYVSLSRDTTETDLKQRREILSSTVHYIDQVGVHYIDQVGMHYIDQVSVDTGCECGVCNLYISNFVGPAHECIYKIPVIPCQINAK